MVQAVNVEDLADAITQAYKEYTDDVIKGVEKETKSTADKMLDETIRLAPEKSGKYKKGFKETKKVLSGGVEYYIWNKKYYNLVHLLEMGHAKVDGGRVPAYPHMRPAYDKYIEDYNKNIDRIIKNGGG